ncbi:HNH endonuclease [Microbacterium phage Coltrane]|uniref:HNH endonuclease n=6 Tax=Armstrongvirus armstrong TaxID=2734217 RepID=A0A3G2KD96_9CAUD|nr:HNH endonuclease [Microbacterium phage Armstrong]AYN55939.1 HNH endonuclease [Microbacterium phage Brahms]AYN57045.1 HNH endonuclease [Microbacterium phage Bernstein]AYN57404.1 HNH endonuclease [Microbacterium phage Coltrane]AYN58992.1 HNH endonuclease [Microbacterium phage Rollins]QED11491.1 HNH endonuclease [Microbacterium phage Vitas]UGL62035.1 HNH endonuclease [Microbacterium phage Skylord]UOK18223.1 HNH endonuclease [Microbacterium phage Clayda5]
MARGSDYRWKQVAAAQRAKRLPCFLCGQPIDYDLEWPDPRSFSADHIRPWARHAELRYDPGNVCSTHLRCNQTKGDSEHFTAGLGALSQEF